MADNDDYSHDYGVLTRLLKDWAETLAGDLAQAGTQVTRTTKLERRQRALAYLLEALTGDLYDPVFCCFPSAEWCVGLLNVLERLTANANAPEVRVACKRASDRLRRALDEDNFRGHRRCAGCDAVYRGNDHKCDPDKVRARDAAMAADRDIADYLKD